MVATIFRAWREHAVYLPSESGSIRRPGFDVSRNEEFYIVPPILNTSVTILT